MFSVDYWKDIDREVKIIYKEFAQRIEEEAEPKLLKFMQSKPVFKDNTGEMGAELRTVCSRIASKLVKKYPKIPESVIVLHLSTYLMGYHARCSEEREIR